MFSHDQDRSALATVNAAWEYAELWATLYEGDDRTDALAILPRIRSLAVLAGRLAKLPMTDGMMAPEALDACARQAFGLVYRMQRLSIAHTLNVKPAERAAQTNTGDGTGKMIKRAKRAQWKQERGLDLTETERKAILKRVRFQLERENGARDNDSTQIRSHNAIGLLA